MKAARTASDDHRRPKHPALTRAQRAYYGAFVLSMMICWSPWKALAYLAPILAVIWFVWTAHNRVARRRAVYWVVGWLGIIAIYRLLATGFDLAPAVLAILTYGTIGALFVIPTEELASGKLLRRMLRLVAVVIAIEAALGIAQGVAGAVEQGGFDIANGDIVQGTIYPSLASSQTFANPMFASNMGFMLIGLLPVVAQSRKWRWTVFLGFMAFLLASVMHAIFFLAASGLAGYLFCRPRLKLGKSKRFLTFAFFALPVIAYLLLGENISSAGPIMRQALAEQSPRAIVLADSFTDLPKEFPLMPLFGLGPGQFSSNAALLASGNYFGGGDKSLPLIKPQSSRAFGDFLSDLLVLARDPTFGGSITVEPFFSWLSVYTEFGIPCLVAIFWWVTVVLLRARREALRKEQRFLGAAVVAGIVFFVLLGFQADYWEVPQAVLIGALLIKAMYATLVGGGKRQVAVPRSGLSTDPQSA